MHKSRESIDKQQEAEQTEKCTRCETIDHKDFIHFNGLCDVCNDDMHG